MTTIREYWLILVFVLALAATLGASYYKLLTGLTERTVAQVRLRK